MSKFSDEQMGIDSEVKLSVHQSLELAIDLARRLHADNDEFDPVLFLNNCSPNEEKYPLGELWAVAQEGNVDVESL